MANTQAERIATLNDRFRQTFQGGSVFTTSGIQGLGEAAVALILQKVSQFSAFSVDNNPHEERDFGSFMTHGEKVFWKIDYFDKSGDYASPDPANPAVTKRVLTIMLASEY